MTGPTANNRPLLPTVDLEGAVRERYSAGAKAAAAELCCPVDYDAQYLKAIPQEVLDRDYGCGDPSRHLSAGETVLDLGSGGGKICFIASQVVGASGRVIGVDVNDDMLALARENAPVVAERVGFANVEFRKARIQDLQLDLDRFAEYLAANSVSSIEGYQQAQAHAQELRDQEPLIAASSVDVVVSNCVLNLVRPEDKEQLFREIFRVLRRGGRAVISDIVSDEAIPPHLQSDPKLWSGCISGAFREDEFLQAFDRAGFHGMEVLERSNEPWQTVEGIEFRSLTVAAYKGKQGPCLERNQAVIYTGPWKEVRDDDGHLLRRGERMAVCDKTYHLYQQRPYAGSIIAVPPRVDLPLEQAEIYDCSRADARHPRETKGQDFTETKGCAPGESCC